MSERKKRARTGGTPVTDLNEAIRSKSQYKRKPPGLITRERRILTALTLGPKTREQVDRIGKVSNGPEYIRQLRERGLEIHCERRCFRNEDGQVCCPGVYRLAEKSVPKAMELLYLAMAG